MKPTAHMMVNHTHGYATSLHWSPTEQWHITCEYVPLYTLQDAAAIERQRIRAALLARHEKSKDRHNYYLCLAREIDEGTL